jgi:CheY-like chemotaxis protein
MGLATVYGIARQHDGWIEVQTVPGSGTTFRVHLPATEKLLVPELPRVVPQPLPGLQPTIFVVEDDASVRGLVKEVLEHHDFRVIEASSGDAALAMWPEIRDRVELLLTDMVMPGDHNGLELAEKLRADCAGLKVIYTSGYSAELFASNVELQEGRNYLPKPYLSSKLVAMLREALCQEAAVAH